MEEQQKKKILVVGLGYIGLPTAAMFSKAGFDVSGYDVNGKVVDQLNNGDVFVEEGVTELIREGISSQRLRGVRELHPADVFIICVPTPIRFDKSSDMSIVQSAAENIARVLRPGNLVILESTSAPGTCMNLISPTIERISGLKAGTDYFLAHSPERVIPGNLLYELKHNHRIIGGIDRASAEMTRDLYRSFVEAEIFLTDTTTAEMAKLMENTYRDVNIALANETAKICEENGVNVWELIELTNKHPRVNLHQPGPGVGGHCIAVDPWFMVELSEQSKMIRLGRDINDGMPDYVFRRIQGLLAKGRITILGMTYKPNTDDFRESPVIELAKKLVNDGNYEVILTDPYAQFKEISVSGARIMSELYDALNDSELLIMGVNHRLYENFDYAEAARRMKGKRIYDTRNSMNEELAKSFGFEYTLLGNGKHV